MFTDTSGSLFQGDFSVHCTPSITQSVIVSTITSYQVNAAAFITDGNLYEIRISTLSKEVFMQYVEDFADKMKQAINIV